MLKRLLTCALTLALALGFAAGAQAKNVKMSLTSAGMAENTPLGQMVKYMAEKLPEYSGGTIETAVFYDAQLGDPTSVVQGLQQGTVDIGTLGTAYFSGLVPQIQVFELPFLFDDYAQARAAVDGPVGQKIMDMYLKKGIKPLGFGELGFRQLTNNLRAVKTPEDTKGLKIRTLPAPVQVKTWELFGALPTPIDVTELYAALQQGIVNAQENTMVDIATKKFYEVQKYMSMTSHVYTPGFLAISQRTWKKLDDTQKAAVERAASEGIAVARAYVDASEKQWIEDCKNAGMEIEFAPDREAFRELAKSAYSFFTEKYGDELLKEIEAGK